jgi:hypothetical protein
MSEKEEAMKKFVLTALVALTANTAYAAQNNVGCGLGSMVFDGKSGVVPQVLAATTNGTSGNQTFGISSGTLGCTQDGVVQSTQKLSMFTGSNMDNLARDMSQGQGEALDTLAELMGVEANDKATFAAATHKNFDKIFASDDVTAEQVLANLKQVMASDATLSRYAA